jgi:hypothetical protein
MRIKFYVRIREPMILGARHGHPGCPRVWPWWQFFALRWVRMGVRPPSSGYCLYLYTRPARARFIEIYFDRVVRRPA